MNSLAHLRELLLAPLADREKHVCLPHGRGGPNFGKEKIVYIPLDMVLGLIEQLIRSGSEVKK